ncbi:MAG: acetyl-CoA carboxylase biotin carboxyl carrier protein subunit [Proteobacteria bacterium]|nr:acetyl-CoA carboxylase biotin carboxyl carrier protein subunit [Pseudomonadota bacterium]
MRMYNLSINGNDYEVMIKQITEETVTVDVNGVEHIVTVNKILNMAVPHLSEKAFQPETAGPLISKVATTAPPRNDTEGCICSPLPGHILELAVAEGDKVLVGQKLLVLEAMKLENIITAEWAGVVKKILVSEGDAVNHDQKLIIIV